jgi:hypothetical protein
MGNFTVLGGLIIKCLVVGLPLVFLLLLLRKKKSRLSTIFILLFFLLTTANAIYFFVSAHDRKIEVSKKYLGFYKLNRLDCKECENCKIDLHSDFKYDIIKDGKIIGNGKWNLEINAETGFYMELDDKPGYMLYDTPREIETIDRIDCCLTGCNENVQEEFSGKIVDIELVGNHFGQKTIFIQSNNGDTIKYYPKYFGHPWIEDKLQVGDYFSKAKQTMNFTVIHKKGDTTFLNYKTPNCANACDTDKMLSDFKDSLDKTRK